MPGSNLTTGRAGGLNSEITPLLPGEVVCYRNSASRIRRAIADGSITINAIAGVVDQQIPAAPGGWVQAAVDGIAMVRMQAGIVPVPGDALFVSTVEAGRATNVVPVTDIAVGIVIDASQLANTGMVLALLRPALASIAGGGGGSILSGAEDAARNQIGDVEVVVYEYNVNFSFFSAANVAFGLSAIVNRGAIAGTGTYNLRVGGTINTADGTIRATISTLAAADEQQTNIGAAFATPAGQQLVKITAAHSVGDVAPGTASIRGMTWTGGDAAA